MSGCHVPECLSVCCIDMKTKISKLIDIVSKLEEHKIRQIDENRKVSQILDELETQINTVRALGSRAIHPKNPHRCPVCNGIGRVLTQGAKCDFDGMLIANLPISQECIGCDGKGILWG